MNYEKITTCDVANGEGVGVVLWVSGCDVCCPGCHNKETWDPTSGQLFTAAEFDKIVEQLSRPEITRFTLSGGHPLMPCNRSMIRIILQGIRDRFQNTKEIWLYTGYKYEDLDAECKYICSLCDVIVDGPYIQELKDRSLLFRGSSNQRIITKHKHNRTK